MAPWPVRATGRAVRRGPTVADDGAALEQCLLLSLGRPVDLAAAGWNAVLECAIAERCVALAWLRSEDAIRRSAPADVVERWQSWVARHRRRVDKQLEALGQVDQWLRGHGISPIVLKGIPLGERLYGRSWARTVNDIDLFVPAAGCSDAVDVLRATGWRHLRGTAPDDVEFVKETDGAMMMLELHTSLAGPWLASHPFPTPLRELATIDGHALHVHAGDFVPAYLASHLLQHSERPLLWIIDFFTLWTGMSEIARDDAREAARRARLAGVLALAERWAAMVELAARERDGQALAAIGRDMLRPTPTVAFAQLLESAGGAGDMGRLALQFAWPRQYRTDLRGGLEFWWQRLTKRRAPAKDPDAPTDRA